MTLKEYLAVLRNYWHTILALGLVGVCCAGLALLLNPATYTATTRMYVSAQIVDTPQAAYQGAELSQDRVKSYSELLTSTPLSAAIIEQLGLQTSPEELSGRIAPSSATNSVILSASVTDTSPVRAAEIANAVGSLFPPLVTQIERPTLPNTLPPVAVRVVETAEVPTERSSFSPFLIIALGLAAGLTTGLAAALARQVMNTSVRNVAELARVTNSPNLGAIPKVDDDGRGGGLHIHQHPQSPSFEAFRQLRTNLQFVRVDAPPCVVVVTSAVAHEGKTTTISNLAIAMSLAGLRVAVVDADLRRPRIADFFDLESSVGLTSVLTGKIPLRDAVQRSNGVDVLTSGPLPPNPSELAGSSGMYRLLNDLRASYDYVLIDSPPVLPVTDSVAVTRLSDGAILVTRWARTKTAEVRLAAESLAVVEATLLGSVLTGAPVRDIEPYGYDVNATDPPLSEGPTRRPRPVRADGS